MILYSNLAKRNSPRAKALNKILGCLNLDLKRVNLEGRNLTGINLRGANLKGVNLTGANLENTDLYFASLE